MRDLYRKPYLIFIFYLARESLQEPAEDGACTDCPAADTEAAYSAELRLLQLDAPRLQEEKPKIDCVPSGENDDLHLLLQIEKMKNETLKAELKRQGRITDGYPDWTFVHIPKTGGDSFSMASLPLFPEGTGYFQSNKKDALHTHGAFTLRTIFMLGQHMVDRLEVLCASGIVHRAWATLTPMSGSGALMATAGWSSCPPSWCLRSWARTRRACTRTRPSFAQCAIPTSAPSAAPATPWSLAATSTSPQPLSRTTSGFSNHEHITPAMVSDDNRQTLSLWSRIDPFYETCFWIPQVEYTEGPLGCSRVINFDHLSQEYEELMAEAGYPFALPAATATHTCKPPCKVEPEELDRDVVELLRTYYARDFERWGGSFGWQQ